MGVGVWMSTLPLPTERAALLPGDGSSARCRRCLRCSRSPSRCSRGGRAGSLRREPHPRLGLFAGRSVASGAGRDAGHGDAADPRWTGLRRLPRGAVQHRHRGPDGRWRAVRRTGCRLGSRSADLRPSPAGGPGGDDRRWHLGVHPGVSQGANRGPRGDHHHHAELPGLSHQHRGDRPGESPSRQPRFAGDATRGRQRETPSSHRGNPVAWRHL